MWMWKVLSSHVTFDCDAYDPLEEVCRYFNSSLEPEGTDPIAWWGVSILIALLLHYIFMDSSCSFIQLST